MNKEPKTPVVKTLQTRKQDALARIQHMGRDGYKVHGDAEGNGQTIVENVALRTEAAREKYGMPRSKSEIPETRARQLKHVAPYAVALGGVLGLGLIHDTDQSSPQHPADAGNIVDYTRKGPVPGEVSIDYSSVESISTEPLSEIPEAPRD